MGTNFNWKKDINIPIELLPKKIRSFAQRVNDACAAKNFNDEHVLVHIGKRSMAGYYCYDCGTTLNRNGTNQIHYSNSEQDKACPICGASRDDENGPVQRVCSFTWTAMAHYELLKAMNRPAVAIAMQLACNGVVIEDEYGTPYTAKAFLKEVRNNPIWYQLPCEFS